MKMQRSQLFFLVFTICQMVIPFNVVQGNPAKNLEQDVSRALSILLHESRSERVLETYESLVDDIQTMELSNLRRYELLCAISKHFELYVYNVKTFGRGFDHLDADAVACTKSKLDSARANANTQVSSSEKFSAHFNFKKHPWAATALWGGVALSTVVGCLTIAYLINERGTKVDDAHDNIELKDVSAFYEHHDLGCQLKELECQLRYIPEGADYDGERALVHAEILMLKHRYAHYEDDWFKKNIAAAWLRKSGEGESLDQSSIDLRKKYDELFATHKAQLTGEAFQTASDLLGREELEKHAEYMNWALKLVVNYWKTDVKPAYIEQAYLSMGFEGLNKTDAFSKTVASHVAFLCDLPYEYEKDSLHSPGHFVTQEDDGESKPQVNRAKLIPWLKKQRGIDVDSNSGLETAFITHYPKFTPHDYVRMVSELHKKYKFIPTAAFNEDNVEKLKSEIRLQVPFKRIFGIDLSDYGCIEGNRKSELSGMSSNNDFKKALEALEKALCQYLQELFSNSSPMTSTPGVEALASDERVVDHMRREHKDVGEAFIPWYADVIHAAVESKDLERFKPARLTMKEKHAVLHELKKIVVSNDGNETKWKSDKWVGIRQRLGDVACNDYVVTQLVKKFKEIMDAPAVVDMSSNAQFVTVPNVLQQFVQFNSAMNAFMKEHYTNHAVRTDLYWAVCKQLKADKNEHTDALVTWYESSNGLAPGTLLSKRTLPAPPAGQAPLPAPLPISGGGQTQDGGTQRQLPSPPARQATLPPPLPMSLSLSSVGESEPHQQGDAPRQQSAVPSRKIPPPSRTGPPPAIRVPVLPTDDRPPVPPRRSSLSAQQSTQ